MIVTAAKTELTPSPMSESAASPTRLGLRPACFCSSAVML